ncbi:hypothetical protein [Caryophanon latum]|uniref:Uncharacterized protein n=1 Tax=Caryophanon latum TaxID=33977 RepID=A0A1C0YWJ3_9BACL|nr:hypothetical protein [Caryophanon latum]OCS91551.1 hypothetical protein A6K76_08540 [Caryophanon latum]
MYRQLTINHCLYDIDEAMMNTFFSLAEKYPMEHDVSTPLALQEVDNWAVVLQIWCLFHEDEHRNLINHEKMMAYSCNYYCLSLLRADKSITSFLQLHQYSDEVKYVLSYYLGYYTLHWIYELINEEQVHKDFINSNLSRNYFLFSEEEQLLHNERHFFYELQKYATNLLASDFHATSRYANYVKSALKQTTIYLRKLKVV